MKKAKKLIVMGEGIAPHDVKIVFEKEWALKGSPILGNEKSVIWLDIETRKIDAPTSWPYQRRWQPFMIGFCGASDPGIFWAMVVASENELALIEFMREFVYDGDLEIRFKATRDFDEMVLRGRFTNARRALSNVPGDWPNLNDEKITWKNIRKQLGEKLFERSEDCRSKDVPVLWAKGEKKIVTRHCLRDVIELFLCDPEVKLAKSLALKLKKILIT
jgi:hypothetical protein